MAAYGAGVYVDRERHVPALRVPPPLRGCVKVSLPLVFVAGVGVDVGVLVWVLVAKAWALHGAAFCVPGLDKIRREIFGIWLFELRALLLLF